MSYDKNYERAQQAGKRFAQEEKQIEKEFGSRTRRDYYLMMKDKGIKVFKKSKY